MAAFIEDKLDVVVNYILIFLILSLCLRSSVTP
jgi:hypothetical protein